ncbi:MAG TPA: MarR family transcriptional regulator [Candidatus Baltobacteraceae bacterium]|jgi:DNA-binding MarR family transcriptional regulator
MDHPQLDAALQLARAHGRASKALDTALAAHHGIGASDFALLNALAEAPRERAKPVDLARLLSMTASGVTRALLPLEKIGIVERRKDERDARISYAALTEAGRRVIEQARVTAELTAAGLFSRLSVGQTRQLQRLLEDIA